ncbi:MAG: HlyD family efflux transporter periplasmic adaptor subunit [Bdellovibrionales bacterium]|nr:HlyD family efflux transporter periplasmic adaptor subunit [Bdellovibrionales bacterium]
MIRKTVEYIRIPKKLFWGIVIGLIVVGSAMALKPKKSPVDMGTVTEGLFQKVIIDEGVSSYKEKHVITAPADGITPTLTLEAGDPVKKGQELVKFEWDSDFKITSPLDGFVLRVFEKDRRHVMRGTPILEVGNPSQVEIIAQILSEEVVEVQVGQKATISKWGGDQDLQAVVYKIEPSAKEEVSALGVKEQRVGVYLNITTDKSVWRSLGDGFRVEVAIVTDEKPKAKLLPIGALFSDQGKPAVFVIENKKIQIHPVEVLARNRQFALLDGDLPVGTQVVLYPGSTLKPGDKIRPQ